MNGSTEAAADRVGTSRGRVVVRVARGVLVVLAGYYAVCLVLLLLYRFVPPPVTGVQLQRRIEALAARTRYEPKQQYRRLASISRHAPRAVVAAEDGRFWRHHGSDFEQLRTAGMEALKGRRVRGASTITQQLMKNLFGCACRNPIRKAYDLALTPAAELILGKQRILELYLNEIEWGRGVWGIEAAARHYYGVSGARLTRTQSAGLAALLPNPRQRTIRNTSWYRGEILRRMRYFGW
jgi:monofunctional biosynthetic peptidoglycan transglycosylase